MEIYTNYEQLLPKGSLFSIKDIEEIGLIKSDMLRKLIFHREIEVVKMGKKNFISRQVLIAFLKENTLSARR
ncbi:FAD-binding protein [Helicobacter acinonychis]|uniref:FAD-binding protein n=1 Tax=Helicobacter acinonychis TaxID=212 RepID=UPI000CF117A5|nr:FAD-binding protein [Helicobacter acinonychis]